MSEELQRNQLLPGHDALVKLIEELGVRMILVDENSREIFISYTDDRMDSVTVLPPVARRD